jgi:glutaminyl-peptide cyclotransferase
MTFSRLRRSRFIRFWLLAVGLVAVLFLMVCDGSPEHFGIESDASEAETTVDPWPGPTPTAIPAAETPTPVSEAAQATVTPPPTPEPLGTPVSTPDLTAPVPTPDTEMERTPEPPVPEADDPPPSVDAVDPAASERWTYEVVATYPHDPIAFTQGLEFVDGTLLESTGLNGRSSLRQVGVMSGDVIRSVSLDSQYFGEGLTVLEGRVYQLTWRTGVAFVYDLDTFEVLEEFAYETEGWGLANDGTRLIMSDGSSTLYFRDPHTFEEIGRVGVYDERGPVSMLNELEYIDGEVFANVLASNSIARIDPESGRVVGWIDLSGLLSEEDRGDRRVDVLNGIAWDSDTGRLFVTGKLWPVLYEIVPVPEAGTP